MRPRFAFFTPSLVTALFAALASAACAHGIDPAAPEDSGAKENSGGGGSGGSTMMVAGSSGDGSSGSVAGSMDLGGGGGGGSDVVADSGSDGAAALDAAADVGLDAPVLADVTTDGSPTEAGPPKRPTGITMSATSMATGRETPSAGGSPYNDECPANQALVGFKGTVDLIPDGGAGNTNLRSVQGVCAPLTVSATEPYRVNVGTTNLLPVRQTPSTVAQTVNCPMNQVIVGFQGRTAMYIEALQFRCAPLVISGSSPTFAIAPGAIMTTGPLGAATAGANFSAIDCPAGQVAVAQAPRAGSAIDSFGLVCRTPTLVIQ